MTKKKTTKKKQQPVEDFELAEYGPDDEFLALCLTYMVSEVNGAINRGATFEIILEMLINPWDEESSIEYGRLIRATSGSVESGDVH